MSSPGGSKTHRPRARAVAIVNELAPGANRTDWEAALGEQLGRGEVRAERVVGFAAARAAARAAAADGAELVIAVGGDGTVNACANGIGDAPTRLAVMPAGTANDLARILGQNGDVATDVAEISSWEHREMDALRSNGTRFYSAGGLGWAAEVADAANRWRSGGTLLRWFMRQLGTFIYTLACIVILVTRRRLTQQFRLRYRDPDGSTHTENLCAYGLLAANCDRLGAAFHLAPVSRIDDGVFELIVFPRMSRLRLLHAVILARRGRLFDVPGIRWVQATSASVECERTTAFFGDGEILERGTRFELGVDATPFRLIAPVAAVPHALPAAEPVRARA